MRQIFITAIILFSFIETLKSQTNDDYVINVDSIYKTEGWKISLIRFDTQRDDESKFNSIFIFSQIINNLSVDIIKDSIFVTVQDIKFEDFNNDRIKDILIQNYSDARSNWTYYLYLVDTISNRLTKINGFEEIKNPKYNSDYDIIENYVMSGRNWTKFYRIDSDRIIDLGITIYDGEDEDGNYTYDEDYKKAINLIKDK